jgi:protein arginine kinase
MLHLPVLVYTKKISQALKNASRVGMVVRGFHGEGSGAFGNMYQVSNQICLGKTEEEIIKSIESVTESLIENEESSRNALLKNSRLEIEDLVFRSYATLKSCRLITSAEAFEHLSNIRLGASLGILTDVGYDQINRLYFLIQRAHIKPYMKTSSDTERLALRAEIIRNNLI